MKDFDRQGLEAFVRSGEKSPPPVFVGREAIILDIEEAAAAGWKGKGAESHGIPGMTRVVQGAPGAGKSSILAKLRSRSAGSGRRPGTPQVMVTSSEEVLGNLPGVLADIDAAAAMSWRGPVGRVKAAFSRLSGVSVFGASVSLSPNDKTSQSIAIRSRLPPGKAWETPVIVAVDEAQNLGPERTSDHALFLQSLHNASAGLPLTLVLAGLGDTRDVAGKCGLTRGLTTHDIAGLAPSDVDELMAGLCRHFGLDPAGCEERLQGLAAPAEGWPRHLHFAMQALAREALKADGDLRKADWPKIQREAAASRLRYYEGQTSPEMLEAAGLTAAVMRGLQPGMRTFAVHELIETSVRDKPGFRLPEGMNVGGFLACLTHNGALQKSAHGDMSAPIPSFRSHLIAAAGPASEPAPAYERPERDETAGIPDEAAAGPEADGFELSRKLQDHALQPALLNPGRGALSGLEQAGEAAERPPYASPDERRRDAPEEAERRLRPPRRALGVDPDHGRTAEPDGRQPAADDDEMPSPT